MTQQGDAALSNRAMNRTKNKSPESVGRSLGAEGRYEPTRVVTDFATGRPIAVTVPDPFEPGRRIAATINIRHDVIMHWWARGRIDAAQMTAGRRFQQLWQDAEIGGPAVIDPSKTRVDGGFPVDPLTDAVMLARRELNALAGALGKIDFPLLTRVVGQGLGIEAEAARWGGRHPERYVARRVRDALATLALHWGATGPDKDRGEVERGRPEGRL
jgi:hypothetical protein